MTLAELKEYFQTNGTILNNKNDAQWKELKGYLLANNMRAGSIRCGSCRRKMVEQLMSI